jgi:hypothetical protein
LVRSSRWDGDEVARDAASSAERPRLSARRSSSARSFDVTAPSRIASSMAARSMSWKPIATPPATKR